jgi:regulator of RNase E activity RraA
VRIGQTLIRPGDFVFGDTDGVVIIPKELTVEILEAAEDIYRRERGMREELRRGVSVKSACEKYGSL